MQGNPKRRRARFDTFEVDLRSGQLYKCGIRLKLQDQPFQVLALLLENPGELVTREELRRKLWPRDCFVDFDTGLNNAIRKLRDALGDSAEAPRYIETLPRRGYRLIPHVENGGAVAPAVDHTPPASPDPQPRIPANWRRLFLAAVAVIVLALAGVASRHFFFARLPLAEADIILLTNFVNKTGDPIFDGSLDKALEVKLAESPFLSLFPEADVRATMRMMRHDPVERLTRDLGIEICQRQGLKAVVVPEIVLVGTQYLITLEAIDARTQITIARQQQVAAKKDQVIAALGQAGFQLRRQLGESLASLEKYDAPLDFATTGSLEALQAYRTGLTQFRAGKMREAVALLERAVELDPQFCSAYRALGSIYANLGDTQASSKNYAKAFELKDQRLTQEENFLTSALYHWSITGNLEKAIGELTLYRQVYPRSSVAANVLGFIYSGMGRTEEALEEFDWALSHSRVPAAADSSNASQALMTLGRIDQARERLDEWWRKGALNSSQAEQRYRIAFLDADAPTMERLAREASGHDMVWLGLQRQLAFFRGDSRKLRLLSDTLVSQQKLAQRMENVSNELARHALLESYLGNYDLARSLCRQAAQAGKESHLWLANCAKALAQTGNTSQARLLAAKLSRLRPEDTLIQQVHLPIIRSIIERQRGNPAEAVDLLVPVARFEQGELQVLYYRAQAYAAAGKYDKAVAEYQRLLSQPGWTAWGVFAPLAQHGLAQTYALQREQASGRKAYETFFNTWKDATPAIPRLRQAKSEYKMLLDSTQPEQPQIAARQSLGY